MIQVMNMANRNSMDLFEVMDAVDAIDDRVKEVEKLSHEPQNYKEKCDEMEVRIEALEKSVKDILYIIGR